MTRLRTTLIALALGLLFAGGRAVWWVQSSEDKAAHRQVQLASTQAALRLQDYLRTRLTVVQTIGHDKQLGLLGDEDRFMRRTETPRTRFGGFKAINWIDIEGSIRWQNPREGNEGARGKNVLEHEDAGPYLKKAIETQEPQMTHILELFQGRTGFATYFPVVRHGELLGVMNGVFDGEAAVRDCFSAGTLESYEVRVCADDVPIYLTSQFEEAGERDFAAATLTIMEREWRLELAPTAALYRSQHPGNAWFVLIGAAGFLAALLGLTVQLGKRRSEEREKVRLAALVEESSDIHLIVGGPDEILYLNAAGQTLLGQVRTAEACRFSGLLHAEDAFGRTTLSARMGDSDRWSGEALLQCASGNPLPVLLRAVRLPELQDAGPRFAVAASDLREQRRMETELRQVQKVEALGHLAGGVAHDFNNLLTALLGYAQMARETEGVPADVVQDLDQIIKAGERGATLTQNLLVMSRRQVTVAKPISLSVQIEQTRELLRTLIPESIELQLSLVPELCAVVIDPVQFEQVLMNLILNAVHAMPDGGLLQISTEQRSEDGEWCVLTIEDNGYGMSPEVQRRATEPFFSTRAQGRGTGLGLFSALGILEAAGGRLNIESSEGEGTRIEVRLPVSAEQPQSTISESSDALGAPSIPACVLLVEDDPDVLEAARRTLENAGHSVHVARDGQEGLKVFEDNSGAFDILVSDIVMPRLGGRELARTLLAQRPDLCVLLCSGYVDKELSAKELDELNATFLVKPYEPGQLLAAVNQQLTERQLA